MENQIKTPEFENRSFATECRAIEKDGKKFIDGYAAVYEKKSKLLYDWIDGSFFEIIQRGAFDGILKDPNLDVIASYNHDYNKIIARTVSKTLELVSDEKGLRYIIEVPDITYARDLYESIKRGDIFESSFTFQIEKQTWSKDSEGVDLRTISEMRFLKEVAPVVWGAYADTKVATRSFENLKKESGKPSFRLSLMQKELELKKIM
jgi:uncharacterized protein